MQNVPKGTTTSFCPVSSDQSVSPRLSDLQFVFPSADCEFTRKMPVVGAEELLYSLAHCTKHAATGVEVLHAVWTQLCGWRL